MRSIGGETSESPFAIAYIEGWHALVMESLLSILSESSYGVCYSFRDVFSGINPDLDAQEVPWF